MTKIEGRRIIVGKSTDDENNNAYEIELDTNANQLNIRDQSTGNEITADVGEGFVQDVVRANSELRLPTYADNTNAVQEDAQIWFNDGSGTNAAGVYHYDGSVIGPLETGSGSAPGALSGLTIDTTKDFDGKSLTGMGHDEVDVPLTVERTVADFEGGTLPQDAVGDTANASVQSTVALEGDYSLEINPSSSGFSFVGFEDNRGSLPQLGDSLNFNVYLTDTDDICFFGLLCSDHSTNRLTGNSLNIVIRADKDKLVIEERVVGSSSVTSEPVTISNHLNEVLQLNVKLGTDRFSTVKLSDSNGNELATVSTTIDSKIPESGGVRYSGDNTSVTPTVYFDGPFIERRETEARTNTQKGTTQLGNEVVPSGSIQTGPTTANTNAKRAIYQDAPVDTTATQGTQSKLTLLQSGLNPAMFMERTLDGQGGAYGHQLQAPLGRFARLNANLSWEYDTFDNVTGWEKGQTGTSFSFSLTNRPRRLQIQHSGSGNSEFGGANAVSLTTSESLDAFRVRFTDVVCDGLGGDNELHVGISDTAPSNDPAFSGNGVMLSSIPNRGTNASFEIRRLSNGSSVVDKKLSTQFFNNNDITIEYTGTELRLFVDRFEVGISPFSYNTNANFKPFIALRDGETTASTCEVQQVTVEPLPEVLQ